jgi:hypothetical protein
MPDENRVGPHKDRPPRKKREPLTYPASSGIDKRSLERADFLVKVAVPLVLITGCLIVVVVFIVAAAS